MRTGFIRGTVLVSVMAFASIVSAADDTVPTGPGWTGASDPQAVISARRALMEKMERLMQPFDSARSKGVKNPAVLRESAEVLSAMLLTVPHLFPPTTNRYDPAVQEPQTLALPAIWKDFAGFERLAGVAVSAAKNVATTQKDAALPAAASAVRAACDACHALYLRKYEPSKVLDSDTEFDFESVLPD